MWRSQSSSSRGWGYRAGFRWRGTGCLLLTAFAPTLLIADFSPPTRITNGAGAATDVVVGADVANNAWVVSVVEQSLQVDVIGANLRASFGIPAATGGQGEPDVANSGGETFICFSQFDPDPGDTGREIFLTFNRGGQFSKAENVSQNRVDDFTPRLALDLRGNPQMVWTQSVGDSSEVVFYDHATRQQRLVGEGSYPSLFLDSGGTAHVVYARDNDLFYNFYNTNRGAGEFDNEIRVLRTPTEAELGAGIGVSSRDQIFIGYASEGSLYMLMGRSDSGFGAPRLLDAGGVLDPELRMRPRGSEAMTLVYAKQGDILLVQGLSGFLLAPSSVGAQTAEVEGQPSLVGDPLGNLHAAFLRDGDVYYTNNAGDVEAEFSAAPRDGEVPLTVEFQDLSAGAVQAWRWDFGDGTQSNSRNPVHTYSEPGKYTVALTVFNADKKSRLEKLDFVAVAEPFNTLTIPDQAVLPNQKGVWFPVIAAHREPIQGFQIHGVFDPRMLTLTEVSQLYTATFTMQPEIWEDNIFAGRFEIGAIFDFEPPFNHATLPAGGNHILAHLLFDVSGGAPPGAVTRVELVNNSDISRIFNIFTVDRFSRLPSLVGADVRIVPLVAPFPRFFLRGDADNNGKVEITDAIKVLNFLFLGDPAPECLDAADIDDSGRVDISAAINLLNFLFLGGPAPRVPFPNAGMDPTEDDLQCE